LPPAVVAGVSGLLGSGFCEIFGDQHRDRLRAIAALVGAEPSQFLWQTIVRMRITFGGKLMR